MVIKFIQITMHKSQLHNSIPTENDMVSINPGVALGGAILGITPGAALEKKSVRDLAANFSANKIGEQMFFNFNEFFNRLNA
jgi:hypothetical protein